MQARASRLLRQKAVARAVSRPFHSSSNDSLPLAGVPAVAQPSAPKGGGSLFSAIFGKASVPAPSMYEPLSGVPVVPPLVSSPAPAETKVTTLANGVTIASQDVPGATATVGIYVSSGSVWETPSTSGASHLLERMAFKSTTNRTHFRLVREIEAIGANCLASASREQMAYTADVAKTFVPEAVEILSDTVRNSLFNDWEVKEQASKLRGEVAALQMTNPGALLLETLHSVAYVGALGNSLLASPAALAGINGQALFDFVAANYVAPRIVVAAAGVPHQDLMEAAEPLMFDLPSGGSSVQPQSKYVGGDFRMAGNSPVTHFALGFGLPGGWRSKDAATAVVFSTLMGGGSSFSAGGPGKGMYSRLYKRVLNKHPEVETCAIFSSLHMESGLIGIQASSGSQFIPNLVDAVINEFTAVASPGGVTEQELERAKNATIASVLMNLESKAVVCDDIGRQILTYGHRKSPESLIAEVKAMTPKDITAFAQKLIKTPISFSAYGDVVHVPPFEQIAARF